MSIPSAPKVVALLEGLRQEVASLTASTHESLLAVSIDALEREVTAEEATVHRIVADRRVRDIAPCES